MSSRARPRGAPVAGWSAFLALLSALAPGCQAGYVLEQGCRQLQLGRKQVPLESPRIAGSLSPDEVEKLHWVPRVLDFARADLGLDPGDSYRTFLDTGGKPVTYVVSASHPLALIPYQWSFPFVGTVPYKGYFDREDAVAEALRLRNKGFEAAVIPVSAFSTLGWFQDPVTSTMIAGSLADLIDTLIHETTHRTLYFTGAATFNESLATHVAREGTRLFIASRPDLRPLLDEYEAARDAAREREDLLLRLHDDLEALYRSDLAEADKLARKEEVFRTAAAAARRLHPGSSPLPASNATLLSIARYHEHEPLLRKLQEARGGHVADLVAYLKTVPAGEDPVAASEQAIAAALHDPGPALHETAPALHDTAPALEDTAPAKPPPEGPPSAPQ